jgi:hypothetical protein
MSKIKTLSGAGVVVSLDAQGGLEVEGLRSLPGPQAQALRRYIKENKALIIQELKATVPQAVDNERQQLGIIEKAGTVEQETKQRTKPETKQKPNPAPRKPAPVVAIHELLDLAQDGRIDLAWTDNGPAWTIPLPHEQLDKDWIGGLIQEAMLEPKYLRNEIHKGGK